jgi:hypothetical protein
MTTWRMRVAGWTTKARDTHTHSEYVINLAVSGQLLLRQCASMLRYTAS